MSEHGSIKFWSEIGRRNVLRVAAVYVGFAWMVIHSGVVMGEALELPHWIMRLISALLIVGFPAVVAFAWVYEITPEGLKRAEAVERDRSITHRTAHRLNIVIIALMILLAGLYGADRFLLPREAAEAGGHAAVITGVNPSAGEGVSIAVLPFLNLSSDKEQEYFSDGMTEEITSALAKVKGLRVVARTSAFKFKGQNDDLRTIGQALGVTNLLEGSVRKAGNRVRITGQLIRASDGSHIWTEDYDRELTDVFKTQDDIAHAIAAALRVPLGLKEGETLVTDRAIGAESYQNYLRAWALHRSTGTTDEKQAESLLENVVAREPGYAPGWGLLGTVEVLLLQADIRGVGDAKEMVVASLNAYFPKAEKAARKAVELDANSVLGQTALGVVLEYRGKWIQAEDAFQKALAIDPDSAEALNSYSLLLARVGRSKQALPLRQKTSALEPLVDGFSASTASVLADNGQAGAAIAILNALPPAPHRIAALAQINAEAGRYGEAADTLQKMSRGLYPIGVVESAVRLLRSAPAAVASPQGLPQLGGLGFVYLYVGAAERVLEPFESILAAGFAPVLPEGQVVWTSAAASVRRTERFKTIARKAGWVDYWRARGWPDLCHPVGADDFECS